jgi:hypothetical protein
MSRFICPYAFIWGMLLALRYHHDIARHSLSFQLNSLTQESSFILTVERASLFRLLATRLSGSCT